MIKDIEDIALFDLDGVLCNYDSRMDQDLGRIANPASPPYARERDGEPTYIKNRINLIRNQPGWWLGLKPYKPGFDILEIARELGFLPYILTRASREAPNSYTEKALWVQNNIPDPEEVKIIEAEDKGVVYGKVFVEDYLKNIIRWLKWRKRGHAIMPEHTWNKGFQHPQVTPYNGKNLNEVREILTKIKERQPGQNL